MSASIAAGIYEGYKQAAGKMVKVKYRVEPNKERADIYNKKYKTYKKAVDALNDLWVDLV